MELIISVNFNQGNFSAKVDSFLEATAVHDWLVDQGLVQGAKRAPADEVIDVQTTAQGTNAGQEAELEAQREAHEAAVAAQAAENARAEAAAQAAAKALAKAAAKKAAAAKEAEKADKPAVSVADVTKAVTDYAAKFGPTEARALFARFGVNRGGDLKPEQFEDFISTARDYIARDIKASDAVMPEGADLM